MGSSESKTISFEIKPEVSNEKGTEDDEAMYQFIEKARNSTCQIMLNNNNYGSGFFCRIPYTENYNLLLNVLLTCEHVLTQEIIFSDNEIEIKVNNTLKKISLRGRKKWSNKKLDYSCFEILQKDEINDFYSLDDIIFKKNYTNEMYINNKMNHIYIFAIMRKKRGHSSGLIKKIDNYNFVHDCNSYSGSSGGVIVNKNNNCVIGIHKGSLETKEKKYKNMVLNIGVFIKDIIEDIKLPKDNEFIISSMNNVKVNKNINIVFVGNCATGAKTNLIWALKNEEASINYKEKYGNELIFTVGFDFYFKEINQLNHKIIFNFIDLQGAHYSLPNNLSFIRKANIIALGYDITDKNSFNDIKNFWLPNIKKEVNKNTKYFLIGNKVDLEEKRKVLREEAEEFANKNNFSFFEVSAYYYINVKELLAEFIKISQK